MSAKVISLLFAIILFPLVIIGWFGIHIANNEQQVIDSQFSALVNAQLASIDKTITDYFAGKERMLLNALNKLTLNSMALRQFVHNSADVRQTFVMSAKGLRMHPPNDDTLTLKELAFVQRTKNIWLDRSILFQTASPLLSEPKQEVSRKQSSLSDLAEPEYQYGWYVWHSNEEINHIFWWKNPDRQLVGVELYPAKIQADIISLLPNTGGPRDILGNARIRLLNDRGSVVYQWGNYQPKDKELSLAFYPLSHPLGSWKLEYFGDYPQHATFFSWFNVVIGMIVVAIALVILAIYLYREHHKEILLATQRVNFVSQVSHELKTPLTNIRLYAELLEDQIADLLEDKSKHYMHIITSECQRLSRLITNVLTFSRSEKNHLQLNPQPAVLDNVIQQVLKSYQAALSAKAINAEFNANANKKVMLDSDIVEQILINLLSNVEKYAASGHKVTIKSWHQQTHSYFSVQDYGPGIKPNEIKAIFQAFYRSSSKLTDGVSGTGIGLTIARQLTQLHAGSIQLIPSTVGACFEVCIHTPAAE